MQLLQNGKQGHRPNVLNVDYCREQGDVSGMRTGLRQGPRITAQLHQGDERIFSFLCLLNVIPSALLPHTRPALLLGAVQTFSHPGKRQDPFH